MKGFTPQLLCLAKGKDGRGGGEVLVLHLQSDKTYLGGAGTPFIGSCASLTIHVTRFGTDADKGISS